MIYKFKSRATSDLIMLEPDGRRMLEIIGKTPGPQGIILVEQMRPAIEALHAAIAKSEMDHHLALERTTGPSDDTPAQEAVSLRQRAVPFIHLLEECAAAGKEIVWGV
ncbi:MAG: SSU ribosomal protein S5p (S2e) [Burkholderiaceae bacterium]|jgi:hypothetical protein|nr:MAG: SSU ribosomal protein S5p (S2e) [Burkholderiaceae bacterium]